jgi:hypothetical protein
MRDIDLTKPSRSAAFHFAQQAGLAAARAAGRTEMTDADKKIASREFARLLWNVQSDKGGLLGTDDAEREEICASDPILCTLTFEEVVGALFHRGEWPKSEYATYLEWERAQDKTGVKRGT